MNNNDSIFTQSLHRPNSRTYFGKGKLEELKLLAEELNAKVVLFDDELSPRHQRELEKEFPGDYKVLDRTALILDIFAQHADTREGMLQVELAQYKYRLPRLTRAWTHLARQAGGAAGRSGSVGGVGLRGPGETQLEVDRRDISKRIDKLEEELEKVRGLPPATGLEAASALRPGGAARQRVVELHLRVHTCRDPDCHHCENPCDHALCQRKRWASCRGAKAEARLSFSPVHGR